MSNEIDDEREVNNFVRNGSRADEEWLAGGFCGGGRLLDDANHEFGRAVSIHFDPNARHSNNSAI